MRSRLDIRYRLAAHVAALVIFILVYVAVDPSVLKNREKRAAKTPPAAVKTAPGPDTAAKAMPADRPTPPPIPPPAAIPPPAMPPIIEPVKPGLAPAMPADRLRPQPLEPLAAPSAQPAEPSVEPAAEPVPGDDPKPTDEMQSVPPDSSSPDAVIAEPATAETMTPVDAATEKPADETPPAVPPPSDATEPDRPAEPAEVLPAGPPPAEPEIPPAMAETPAPAAPDAEAITGIDSPPGEPDAAPAAEANAVPPDAEPAVQQPDESGALVVATDDAAEQAVDAVPIPDTRFETLDDGVYWFSNQEDAEHNLGRLPADTRFLVLAPNRESDPPEFGDHAVYSLSAAIPDLGYEAAAEFLDLAGKRSDGPLAAVKSTEAEAAAFFKGAYLMVVKDARLDAALLEIAPDIEAAPVRDDIVRLLSRLDVESLRREFR